MTLNEYLNQTDPQREVKVILNETEYRIGPTFQIGEDVLTLIEIPAITALYGIKRSYVQVNDEKRLYVPNLRTGLPLGESVFYLP